MNDSSKDIDAYIAEFPSDVRKILQQIRRAIRDAEPLAHEAFKYAMPAFELNGPLVYFAAYQNHIGFYATPTGHKAFKKELSGYRSGKGSVQFPITKPMPIALITKIVKFRVKENMAKAQMKSSGPARKKRVNARS